MFRTLLGLLASLAATSLAVTQPAAAQSMIEGTFDPAIPTLAEVAGHASGEQVTRPEILTRYLEALARAAPDRVQLVQYATSWEGRPLHYAVISSPTNMARIASIKADMQTLADGASPAVTSTIAQRSVPVTWLASSVHGNEISPADSSLVLAYHLLASQDDELVDTILANSVIVIDPSQNPDGRARFTSSFYQQLGIAPSASRYTAGHDEPWPGGRFNHYLFDLNRDWFALTQPETRGKVAAVLEWNPVVFVDSHEMGGDTSYFFPPSAEPFNPYITAKQWQKQELLGRNIARYLETAGTPYFTREVYDAFYPGYGDTWPTLNGASAMTFEQSSARGLVWERRDGTMLTYGEGVRNNFLAKLATAETVARNAGTFLTDFAEYRRSAAQGAAGTGDYVIDLSQRHWNAAQLGRRLATQGIAVRQIDGPASACGRSYPRGYLAISQSQPAGRLVRTLLERQTDLDPAFVASQEALIEDGLTHEIYDTTAWSVGLMSGVDVRECAGAARGTALAGDAPMPSLAAPSGAFGLAVPWTDSGQVRLVSLAVQAGLRGRASEDAFTVAGREFPRGSVVFTLAANDGDLSALVDLASEIGAETVALDSSWVDAGPNLGSDSFALLAAPRVAMLWDDGVSPLSAGATRYVLEQRFGLPVAPIRTRTVSRADLSDWDVLIVPEGNPVRALGDSGVARIKEFAQKGGVVVAYSSGMMAMSGGDNPLFAVRAEKALGVPADAGEDSEGSAEGTTIESEADYLALIADPEARPDTLPGALLNTVGDDNSFLSAGYTAGGPVVFADGDLVLQPLSRDEGANVIRFADASSLVASGHVWDKNRRQMAFKPYMIAQPRGGGLAIGFTHDPTVRGYLDGLDMLVANAVLIAPSRVR